MTKQLEVLLVEDDAVDVQLLQIALRRSTLNLRLNVCDDGEKALKYLHRQEPYHEAERPDLVLLDNHLPKMTGSEVLEEIKTDRALQHIPVILLTTAAQECIVQHVSNFPNTQLLVKPFRIEEYQHVVKSIAAFCHSTL